MSLPKELMDVLKTIPAADWTDIKMALKDQKERIKLYQHISKIINEIKQSDQDQGKISRLKKKFNIK